MDAPQLAREDLNRALLETLPGLLFVQDAEGTFLEWRGNQRNLYLEPEQFLGRRFRDVFPRPFSDLVEAHNRNTLGSGSPEGFEYELEDASGHPGVYECRMVPFEAGTVLSLITEKAEMTRRDRVG